VMMALRIELGGQDHPVGRAVRSIVETSLEQCAHLVEVGRQDGSIPAGPPAETVALALVGAVEGAVIALAGQAPYDEELAARTAAGILGLEAVPGPGGS